MMRIDAAMFAEIMLRDARIPLIQRKRILAFGEPKLLFRQAQHDCVLAAAKRAVAPQAGRQLAFDFELHRAAMARSFMYAHQLLQNLRFRESRKGKRRARLYLFGSQPRTLYRRDAAAHRDAEI